MVDMSRRIVLISCLLVLVLVCAGCLTTPDGENSATRGEKYAPQAQRTALANQLAQYNRIMEMAENVSEILEVQTQIERVQVELDRINGRLKYLDNRVDYATITVTLQEPEPVGGGGRLLDCLRDQPGYRGFPRRCCRTGHHSHLDYPPHHPCGYRLPGLSVVEKEEGAGTKITRREREEERAESPGQ